MMTDDEMTTYLHLYTIGHSTHPPDRFALLLKEHRVTILVDIRSRPYSKHVPQFNLPALNKILERQGIRYEVLGRQLGGRPPEPEMYDAQGHALYARLSATPRFIDGISTLRSLAEQGTVAIMCSEEDPIHCHRRLLVGWVALREGIRVTHIRGDGRTEVEEGLWLRDQEQNQTALFDRDKGVSWRSTQSVSPGELRRTSSDH